MTAVEIVALTVPLEIVVEAMIAGAVKEFAFIPSAIKNLRQLTMVSDYIL